MNIYILLAIIPVVLAVALIVALIRRNITENRGGGIDIAPAIPAIVVLMIAILVIVPMSETVLPYSFDERSGDLVIEKNISESDIETLNSIADDVVSLTISEDVETIAAGAFAEMTGLTSVIIESDSTEIGSGAFSATFQSPTGSTIQPGAGEYCGFGDGVLWESDPSLFTYSGTHITGLSSAGSSAVAIVIPATNSGVTVTDIQNGTTTAPTLAGGVFQYVLHEKGSEMTIIGNYAFYQNTALKRVDIPDTVNSVRSGAFYGCSALESVHMSEAYTVYAQDVFRDCASLSEINFSKGITAFAASSMRGTAITELPKLDRLNEISANAFNSCTSLTKVYLPKNLARVASNAFVSCTAIEEVQCESFVNSGAFLEGWAPSWTFYASDGTTELAKTSAGLSGKTFMGTAAALVQVPEGMLSLTPLQLQQVQLHTQELQDQPVSFDPLPFQPAVQTQDQEQETA